MEEKLKEGLERISKAEREQAEKPTIKQEQIELKNAKESLWRLRTKENKLVKTRRVQNIQKLEKKTEQVINLLEK